MDREEHSPDGAEVTDHDISVLLQTVLDEYGYDFRHYARTHIKRRIRRFLGQFKGAELSELQKHIRTDRDLFLEFLMDMTVHTTELFRNPEFYYEFRTKVVPILRTYPSFKIWHAGCSTGEEVYSMAILLREEKIYEKARIYATDLSPLVVRRAREGIFRLGDMKGYTRNYHAAGGVGSLSDYYTSGYDGAVMDKSLGQRIVFSTHNLVSDASFGEMHVIVCRNVLIYFDRTLQDRVIRLFHDSLIMRGFLCLGDKETTRISDCKDLFDDFAYTHKIFRRRE